MNRSELRALAEAATPDEWVTLPTLDGSLAVAIVVGDLAMEIPVPVNDADAVFIAATDPSTVLALLDRLDAAEALLREQHADEGHHRSIGTLRGEECMFCGVPVPCAHNRTRAFLAEDTP